MAALPTAPPNPPIEMSLLGRKSVIKPVGPEVMTLRPVIFAQSKPNWRSLVRETSII